MLPILAVDVVAKLHAVKGNGTSVQDGALQ